MRIFKRKKDFIAMQNFRDGRGIDHLIFLTRKQAYEFDMQTKTWHSLEYGVAKDVKEIK